MASDSFSFAELLHFGGFDYAGQKHYVVVVDRAGSKVLSMEFGNNAEGWRKFLDQLSAFPKLAFTIETCCGADVERLLAADLPVFPINPKAAQRYRERKSVSGCKSDELDAFCMADALRTDGTAWRRLTPMDPLTQELRTLCRDEVHLIEIRTSLINQKLACDNAGQATPPLGDAALPVPLPHHSAVWPASGSRVLWITARRRRKARASSAG